MERAAKREWDKLCRSVPFGSDSQLWLEIKPVTARAAQLQIDSDNIRFQLGLDAQTRVITEETQPDCPFPETLILEAPHPGHIEIMLLAEIDYATLEAILAKEVVGKTFGEDISVTVEAVKLRPHGDSLLLETMVAAKAAGWLGTRAEGTLYLLAKPQLDAEAQTITLSGAALDTASRNALVDAMGEAFEPLLLRSLGNRMTLDLGPKHKELRARADAALDALSSGDVAVDGRVEDVRLSRLDIEREHLRLVAAARGSVTASVQTIPWSEH